MCSPPSIFSMETNFENKFWRLIVVHCVNICGSDGAFGRMLDFGLFFKIAICFDRLVYFAFTERYVDKLA